MHQRNPAGSSGKTSLRRFHRDSGQTSGAVLDVLENCRGDVQVVLDEFGLYDVVRGEQDLIQVGQFDIAVFDPCKGALQRIIPVVLKSCYLLLCHAAK